MVESWDRAIALANAAVLRSDDGSAMAHTEAHLHTTATHTNPYPDSTDPYGPGPTVSDPGRYQPNSDPDTEHPNAALDQLANHRRDVRGGRVEVPLDVDGAGSDVRVPGGFTVCNETRAKMKSASQAELAPGCLLRPGVPSSYGGTDE